MANIDGDTLAVTPGTEPGTGVSQRIRPARPSLPPGTRDYPQLTIVDPSHYVIGEELARGGMGRIQIARDRRLGREVAVKELLVTSGSVARRFEREARITARLQHPSIVSVHEAGVWPSGEPFYAMRLIIGRSLDEVIADAKAYAERLALLPTVLAISDAMAYAHREKIIHRDLKPKNVVVGAFGETVVIDWGLAKELGTIDDSLSGIVPPAVASGGSGGSTGGETTFGEVLGTPAYMPPEQAEGATVDERADVYAIGSILYHVLAGRAPYLADTNAELIAALHAAPPLPIAELVPEAPRELTAIVERAMARDKWKRYPDAQALAEDLRRFQTGQLVGAHRYSLRQLLRRWIARNRTVLVATAAALVVAAVIGVISVRRILAAEAEAQAERAVAVEKQQAANRLNTYMLGELQRKLADTGKLELLEDVATQVATELGARSTSSDDDAYLAAKAQLVLGSIAAQRGNLDAAIASFAKARLANGRALAARPDDVRYVTQQFDVERKSAEADAARGDRKKATATLDALAPRILANLERHPDDAGSLQAAYLVRRRAGRKLEDQRNIPGALGEYHALLAIAEHLAKVDPRHDNRKLVSAAHAVIGDALDTKHDVPGALAEHQLALAVGKQALAEQPKNVDWLLDVAMSELEVAVLLYQNKDHAAAYAGFATAAADAKRALSIDPSNVISTDTEASIEEKWGMALFGDKDFTAALAHYQRYAEIYVDLSKRDPSNVDWMRGHTLALNKLGDIAGELGDTGGAIGYYSQALAIREQVVAKDPTNAKARRDLFFSQYRLAMFYDKLKDTPHAIAALRAAAEVADVTYQAHPSDETYANDVVQTHSKLANALKGPEARTEHQHALDIARAMILLPSSSQEWKKTIDGLEKNPPK